MPRLTVLPIFVPNMALLIPQNIYMYLRYSCLISFNSTDFLSDGHFTLYLSVVDHGFFLSEEEH
jgi:hypothetical protein